ncbi:SRPBCC domain-containing protein [Pelagerythrobacter marensis]|uniref:SRPBCC domain-containing protein n=1 Tax=Pelagerythrobacter marensis TaxID=543877 RepID=A0ABZ2D5K9_9SPHN
MTKRRSIEVEHVYAHPPAKVWKALTDPKLHARWWAAGDVRPVVGHTFELDMGKWGMQPCEVLQVEPERLLQYRFALDTIITWHLSPEGGGTRLKLVHDGFDLDSPLAKQAYEGMRNGWPAVLEHLGETLDAAIPSGTL